MVYVGLCMPCVCPEGGVHAVSVCVLCVCVCVGG